MTKDKKEAPPEEYRALYGLSYPHPDKTDEDDNPVEVRVAAGDKLTVLPDDDWVQVQLNKGIIEVWESGNTDNVATDEGVVVTGVVSRHADGGDRIVLKEVNDNA